jgi:hypothetical protein
MIAVDKVYNIVSDLLSKNNGVTLSPEEFDRYAEMASVALQDDYRGANTATKVSYGRNRTLDSRLRQFRVSEHPLSLDLLGYGDYPEDWVQTLNLRTVDYKPIRPIDEDRVSVAVSKDPYTTPTEDEMIYEDLSLQVKVQPAGEASVVMSYLRRPQKARYATIEVNRRPVFDPNNSQNFDWDESQLGELTFRILQLVGVSMDKGQVIQYTAAKQQEE